MIVFTTFVNILSVINIINSFTHQLTIFILALNKTYFISIVMKKNAMPKTLIVRSILNVKVINAVNCNNVKIFL